MSLKDYSTTAASNTSAPPNGAPEGMTMANVNNVMRQMMADVRTLAAEDTIASAATCDLGTKDATFLTITGTTTITGLGTVSAGIYKFVKFDGILTLTHNATSLILRTGANRTTAAGDVGLYKSEGSGNWREYFYSPAGSYQPLDADLTEIAALTTTSFGRSLLEQADAAAARVTLAASSILGAFRNLQASATGTGANVTVTADEIVVENSSNDYKTLRSVSLTINTAATGAMNALDTGTLSASTWYSVWVYAKADGTTAGLISAHATAPTVPDATYTYKARVGWIRTDGTANKYPLGFKQVGARVQYKVAAASNLTAVPVMASGTQGTYAQTSAPTWQAIAVGDYVPSTAGSIFVGIGNNYNNGAVANIALAPNDAYSGPATTNPPPMCITGVGCMQETGVMVLESTNIYVASANAGAAVYCYGWEDSL